MRDRVPMRVAVVLLVLSVVLAACGGGDAPEATEVPATATAEPFVTPSPVVFEHDPEPLVTGADLAATAEATGCPVSSYTELDEPSTPRPVLTFVDDGITAIPDTWLGGRWYEGPNWIEWQAEIEAGASRLTVSATPVDVEGEGDLDPIEQTVGISEVDGGFTEVILAEPGCWDISAVISAEGHPERQELDFTIWVLPFEERSDMAPIFADNAARAPYPIPADCAVTAIDDVDVWLAPRTRQQLSYTIEGDGLALSGELPLLVAGEEVLRWYADPWARITVAAALASGGTPALLTNEIRTTDATGEHLATTLLFPREGCWTLRGTTEATATEPTNPARVLEATVYGYPESCRSEPGQPIPEACTRPE